MMSDGAKVVIGLLGLAAVGVGAYALAKPSASSSSTTTTAKFVAGRRYRVTITSASSIPTPPTLAQAQQMLDQKIGAGTATLVSLSMPDAKTIAFVMDVLKDNTYDPAAVKQAGITVEDLGLSPQLPPPANASKWTQASNVQPKQRARVAMDASMFASYAAAVGIVATPAALRTFLTQFNWVLINVWPPGDAQLPADWPTDDPDVAHEWHWEFTNGSTIALPKGFDTILWVYPLANLSSATWTKATTINPGDTLRVSINDQDARMLMSALGLPATAQGFLQLLQSPSLAGLLASSGIVAYVPGQALPSNWPSDDVQAAQEWHFEFTYGGSVPIATLPIPGQVWKRT